MRPTGCDPVEPFEAVESPTKVQALDTAPEFLASW